MRLGLVRLVFKKSFKPNKINAVWIGSVDAVYVGVSPKSQSILIAFAIVL
jgi:hypothetical protein